MRAAVQGAGPVQRPATGSIRRLTYSRRSGSCGAPWSGGPGPRPRNRGARRGQPVSDNCAASSTQPWPATPSPPAVPCGGSACTSSSWSRRRPASRAPLSGRAPVRRNSADMRKQAAARSTRRAPRRWHIRRPPATPREAERGRRAVSWWWSRAGRRSRAQKLPLRRPQSSSPSAPSCVRPDATSTAACHAASTPAAESPQR